LNVGRNLAGVAGEALMGFSEGSPLMKAEIKPAKGGAVPTDPADEDPKSLFWDPFAIIEQLGYKERPSAITYGTLKSIAFKTPIVHAIIKERQNQIASFAVPSHDRYQLGFRLKLRDSEREPTKQDKKWIQTMEDFMLTTGVTDNPMGREDLESFLKKISWDSLVYDQMAFEVVPNKKGTPAEFYAVDAATIRKADSASTYLNESLDQTIRHVQIYDGMIVSEYNQEELCFGVRNPRTDIRNHGYGTSELEMLINTVTALLWSFEYNQRAFSQGSVHKGILNFKGAIPEKQMRAFRRHWYQMLSGVENAWRTPITNAEDLQWHSMHQTTRDMEYTAWMDSLIKITCAMFHMDPLEVNFKYGNAGQRGAMNETSNKEKLTESRERGLRPLLRFVAGCLNKYVIWPTNPNFEFAFVGLDATTRSETADLGTKLVKSTRTVDEIRAEDDLPPLPDGQGEVILDPVWFQAYQNKQAQAQAEEQGFGDEGGEAGFNFEEMLGQMDQGADEEKDQDKGPPPRGPSGNGNGGPPKNGNGGPPKNGKGTPAKTEKRVEPTQKSIQPSNVKRYPFVIDMNI
jgi:hypothetical protein